MADPKKKATKEQKKPIKLDLITKGEGFKSPTEGIGSIYLLTILFLLLTLAFLYMLHRNF